MHRTLASLSYHLSKFCNFFVVSHYRSVHVGCVGTLLHRGVEELKRLPFECIT